VEMLPLNVVNIIQYGETHLTSSIKHIKSLDKMFQQLQVDDLLEKGLSWKGGCFSGLNHHNDEGSSNDNITEFESEIDEEDAQLNLIMQENDAASKDDLKDQGLNHLLQQESANLIVNLILQNQHYILLEEYITKRDDYANWLQWGAIEKLKNLKGCFVNMLVLNPVHLDHENMQHVVPSKDERWDEI